VNALNVGGTLTDTFSYQVSDGAGGFATASLTVTIHGTNDAPVIDVDGVASYTTGGAAAAIDSTITITDVDNANLTGATISITGNFQSGDSLNFINQLGITGSYNAGTGVLTLTGMTSRANYETAIESITFSSTSSSTLTRTVSYTVNDGAVNSVADTATVNVVSGNTPPVANDDSWVLSDQTAIAAAVITASWFTNNDTDADGNPLFVTAVTGLPAGLTAHFDGAGHLIDITGTSPLAGTYTIGYTLSDGTATDTGSVSLKVLDTTSNDNSFTLDGNDFSYVDALSGDDTLTGDVVLTGNAGIDTFLGNNGKDTLSGGAGDDKLFGNENDDKLIGGNGKDVLDGGNNDDILQGDAGADTLTGGGGKDTFVYLAAGDSTISAMDVLTDFTHGDDKIDVSAFGFTGSAASAIKETAVGAFTAANTVDFFDQSGTDRGIVVEYSGGAAQVYVDVNKDGNFSTSQDLVVHLNTVVSLALDVNDFKFT
jgi:Ca2+-binding RTX toxin-like protein